VPGPLVPTIDEFMREAVADLCRAAIGATGPLVDSARRPWSSATHLRPRVELARGEARSRRRSSGGGLRGVATRRVRSARLYHDVHIRGYAVLPGVDIRVMPV
jgi:hypothetical protein